MYQIIRYPDNHAIYSNSDFAKCVKYLEDFNDKLTKYKIKTEKTETFITINEETKEDTVYSIEYNESPIPKNIYAFSNMPIYGSKEWVEMCERFFGGGKTC